MADDQTKIQQVDTNLPQDQHIATDIPERPIDPAQNTQDMFNDTQGLSGVTQGGLQQTSTEPQERLKDTSFIRGGVQQNPTQDQPSGYPKSAVSDKSYDRQVQQGMSQEKIATAKDTASEPSEQNHDAAPVAQQAPSISPQANLRSDTTDNSVSLSQGKSPTPEDFGDQAGTKYTTTQDAPYQQPYNQGEQDAAGGSTSDPRTDDDALEMAQRSGFQTSEDTEHPQPIDAGRDIDKAQEKT